MFSEGLRHSEYPSVSLQYFLLSQSSKQRLISPLLTVTALFAFWIPIDVICNSIRTSLHFGINFIIYVLLLLFLYTPLVGNLGCFSCIPTDVVIELCMKPNTQKLKNKCLKEQKGIYRRVSSVAASRCFVLNGAKIILESWILLRELLQWCYANCAKYLIFN